MTTQTSARSSSSHAEAERSRHRDQDNLEIDRLVADVHARLPRGQAQSIGAIYARYSSRYQDSIVDQVRTLLDSALAQQIFVPREFIYFDNAVRGAKDRRPGLDRLRSILARKAVQVLMVFSTNRLYRKTYKALQFVEEELVERGIRCLFVKSGVDTADADRWRMMMQHYAMMDEFVVGMYAANVRAAHEGLFDRGLVCCTIPFGYRGREVAGEKSRRQRPRRAIEINPQTAPWVEKAFRCFVEERLSIGEIVRRFNADPSIPRSPRSLTEHWSHGAIRYLLSNPRYRGHWEYGAAQNVWQSKKDYVLRVPRDQPLRTAQMESLRIVPDDLWFRAQQRLSQACRADAGRKPKGGDPRSRPRLIHGLFVCPVHDQILYVGGCHGQSLFCKVCRQLPADQRPLYSLLPRRLALTLTCRTLADLLRQDSQLVAAVIDACRRTADELQRPDPEQLKSLRSLIEQLGRQIRFIMYNLGDTEVDHQESANELSCHLGGTQPHENGCQFVRDCYDGALFSEELRELRRRRTKVDAEIKTLEAAGNRPAVVPTEDEVRELLARFEAILTSDEILDDVTASAEARQIIDLLTGGRIELFQRGEPKAQRGWLQGRFRLQLLYGLVQTLAGSAPPETLKESVITIDYFQPTPSEGWADRVKEFYDQGMLIKAIADDLGITRNQAAKALDSWYQRRGMAKPDGRSRRATLTQKHLGPPLYMQLAEDAMRMYNDGHSYDEIATQLNCCRPTITKVIRHWHQSQGLSAPDGRTRPDLDRGRSESKPDDDRFCDPPPSAA